MCRSLEIGKEENLPSLILLTLVAVARLLIAEGKSALAGETMALVYDHPVSWQWGREWVSDLACRFDIDIQSAQVEAVMRGLARDQDATAGEVVAVWLFID